MLNILIGLRMGDKKRGSGVRGRRSVSPMMGDELLKPS